ncbi:MAG: MaoC family dehydratase N-terminal domain-containing protein [Dehalococcoidia bacterium]
MISGELPPELQEYVGRVSSFVEGPDEVNKAMIRHWCEMVEDANPLYTDEEYARNSEYGGIISPPPMLTTWVYPRWWPPVEMPPDVGPAQLDLPLGDFPIPAVIGLTEEYLLPVRPGDRIRYNTRLESISPLKRTRLGVGHFITTVNCYYNQRDELVGTTQYVLLMYRLEE